MSAGADNGLVDRVVAEAEAQGLTRALLDAEISKDEYEAAFRELVEKQMEAARADSESLTAWRDCEALPPNRPQLTARRLSGSSWNLVVTVRPWLVTP